jgi:hypothetical protein
VRRRAFCLALPGSGGRPGRIDIALSMDLKKKVAGATEWRGAVVVLPAAHQLLHSLTLLRPFSMDHHGGDGRMWPWPWPWPPRKTTTKAVRHRSTGGTTAGTGTPAAAATPTPLNSAAYLFPCQT